MSCALKVLVCVALVFTTASSSERKKRDGLISLGYNNQWTQQNHRPIVPLYGVLRVDTNDVQNLGGQSNTQELWSTLGKTNGQARNDADNDEDRRNTDSSLNGYKTLDGRVWQRQPNLSANLRNGWVERRPLLASLEASPNRNIDQSTNKESNLPNSLGFQNDIASHDALKRIIWNQRIQAQNRLPQLSQLRDGFRSQWLNTGGSEQLLRSNIQNRGKTEANIDASKSIDELWRRELASRNNLWNNNGRTSEQSQISQQEAKPEQKPLCNEDGEQTTQSNRIRDQGIRNGPAYLLIRNSGNQRQQQSRSEGNRQDRDQKIRNGPLYSIRYESRNQLQPQENANANGLNQGRPNGYSYGELNAKVLKVSQPQLLQEVREGQGAENQQLKQREQILRLGGQEGEQNPVLKSFFQISQGLW